jgi:hypothetical protein
VVYLQGGWYDFFLRGMLADYAALQTAGRTVRLLIGPWGHGRGLYTRVGMRDAFAARWIPCSATARRPQGCGCSLLVPAAGPKCPARPRLPVTSPGICIRLAGSAPPAQPTPGLRAGFATTRRTRPRPSQVPPSACLPALPTTAASKPDRMFLRSPATRKPPIWR